MWSPATVHPLRHDGADAIVRWGMQDRKVAWRRKTRSTTNDNFIVAHGRPVKVANWSARRARTLTSAHTIVVQATATSKFSSPARSPGMVSGVDPGHRAHAWKTAGCG